MSYTVSNTTITLTRGDTCRLKLDLYDYDGDQYIPDEKDIIKFSVKKTYDDLSPLIVKKIPVDTLVLTIEPKDTKPLSFGTYVYDIELTRPNGDVDTFMTKCKLKITEEVS